MGSFLMLKMSDGPVTDTVYFWKTILKNKLSPDLASHNMVKFIIRQTGRGFLNSEIQSVGRWMGP